MSSNTQAGPPSLARIILVALAVEAAVLAVYLFLAMLILSAGNRVPEIDRQLKESLHQHATQHETIRQGMILLTQLGSTAFLGVLSLVVAVIVWWKDQRVLAVLCMLGIAGGGLFNLVLKGVFERPRPRFEVGGPFVREEYYSFVSGHSMGSTVAYALVAYLLCLVLPKRWQRLTAVALLTLLVLAIGFSRIYLGAHYFTDVIGGFALGTAWVTPLITGIEIMRRRQMVGAATPVQRGGSG
jgi:membrane-associated phospholipid phosphatase